MDKIKRIRRWLRRKLSYKMEKDKHRKRRVKPIVLIFILG